MNFDQATNLWREIEIVLLKQKWAKNFKGRVLDLGCGEGEVAKEVFGKKLEWGLDNDQVMVKKAEKSGNYCHVILGEAAKMPLKSRTVDLVFSNSVLEHIPNIDQVLAEIRRVLRPGGLLMATMPSHHLSEYLGWGRLYAQWFNQKYHHYHLYSLTKWEELLRRAGLKLVDSYYYLDKPTIREWHRLLWLNKFKIQGKVKPGEIRELASGAGVAILAKA